MPALETLNAAEDQGSARPCPHCNQPAGPRGLAHWQSPDQQRQASVARQERGRVPIPVACPRSPARVGKFRWAFCCPMPHTCYAVRRLPEIPGDGSNDPTTNEGA